MYRKVNIPTSGRPTAERLHRLLTRHHFEDVRNSPNMKRAGTTLMEVFLGSPSPNEHELNAYVLAALADMVEVDRKDHPLWPNRLQFDLRREQYIFHDRISLEEPPWSQTDFQRRIVQMAKANKEAEAAAKAAKEEAKKPVKKKTQNAINVVKKTVKKKTRDTMNVLKQAFSRKTTKTPLFYPADNNRHGMGCHIPGGSVSMAVTSTPESHFGDPGFILLSMIMEFKITAVSPVDQPSPDKAKRSQKDTMNKLRDGLCKTLVYAVTAEQHSGTSRFVFVLDFWTMRMLRVKEGDKTVILVEVKDRSHFEEGRKGSRKPWAVSAFLYEIGQKPADADEDPASIMPLELFNANGLVGDSWDKLAGFVHSSYRQLIATGKFTPPFAKLPNLASADCGIEPIKLAVSEADHPILIHHAHPSNTDLGSRSMKTTQSQPRAPSLPSPDTGSIPPPPPPPLVAVTDSDLDDDDLWSRANELMEVYSPEIADLLDEYITILPVTTAEMDEMDRYYQPL